MLALFAMEFVDYEASLDTFLALCDSEATAVKVAQKYCVTHINREIERFKKYFGGASRIEKYNEMLEDIETSSTLEQITKAYKVHGAPTMFSRFIDGFYTKDYQLITDPADYLIEE